MIQDPEQAMRDLVERLAQIPLQSHQAEIQETYHAAVDYAEHNEWGLGLEILCDNLYEYDFPLPQPIFEQIALLGDRWEIDSERIQILRDLIPAS